MDLLLGTSAGSVLAAALRCGVSAGEMVAHQRGEPAGPLAEPAAGELAGEPWPRPPHLRIGSPRLALATLLRPHRMHPAVGASAWLPHGRGNHRTLHGMVQALHEHAHAGRAAGASPPGWVAGGETWIAAVDYDSGRQVIPVAMHSGAS